MLPFMIPMLIGAGTGALLNRKDPLKGALMGAAGGAIAPGLSGLLGGAGGAASGAASAAAPASLANVALPGAGTAGFNAAGAAIDAGIGQAGVGMAQQAGGLLGQGVGQGIGMFDKVSTIAKPVMQGVQTAQSMMPQDQPMQIPQAPRMNSGPPDLNGILNLGQQQRTYNDQMAELRRQKQQAAIQRMMG